MCQYSTVTLIPMNILEHLSHSGWVQPERESIPMMWLAWSTVLALKYSQIVSNVFVQITTCICPRSPLTVWLAWSTVLAFQRRRTHQKTTIHTMYLIHSVIHSAIYLHKHLQHQVHMDKQFVDLPCSPFSIYTYPGCWVDNFNYIFDGVEFVFELHCRYNSSSSFCKRYAGGDALYRSSCIFFEFLYLWTIRDINNISEINKNVF